MDKRYAAVLHASSTDKSYVEKLRASLKETYVKLLQVLRICEADFYE